MAKIPVYDSLQVAPSNVPQVQFAQQGNLFGGLGQGLQQAGAGMMEVAAEQNRQEEELAQTAYLEASSMRAADLDKLKIKYGTLRGKAALDKQPEYEAEALAINEKYAANVSNNKKASEKYRITAIPALSNTSGALTEHANVEYEKHNDAVDQTGLQSYNRNAKDEFHNNKKLGQDIQLELADDVIRSAGRRKGLDQKVIDASIASNRSAVHSEVVTDLIGKQKYQAAQAYYDNNADSIQKEERSVLDRAFATIKDEDTSRSKTLSLVAELQAKYPNDPGKQQQEFLATVDKEKDATTADAMQRRGLSIFSLAKETQAKVDETSYNNVEEVLRTQYNGYPDPAFFNTPEWIALSTKQRNAFTASFKTDAYTVDRKNVFDAVNKTISEAQVKGDFAVARNVLRDSRAGLTRETAHALAQDIDRKEREITKQTPTSQDEAFRRFHTELASGTYLNGKSYEEWKKADPKKAARYEASFYNWYDQNKDKPITQSAVSDMVRSATQTRTVSGVKSLIGEAAIEMNVMDANRYVDSPWEMPDEVQTKMFVNDDPETLRSQAKEIKTAYNESRDNALIIESGLRGISTAEERTQAERDFELDNKRRPEKWELANAIMLRYAKKVERRAIDAPKLKHTDYNLYNALR